MSEPFAIDLLAFQGRQVRVPGELDLAAGLEFSRGLGLLNGQGSCVIDLCGCTFIDPTASTCSSPPVRRARALSAQPGIETGLRDRRDRQVMPPVRDARRGPAAGVPRTDWLATLNPGRPKTRCNPEERERQWIGFELELRADPSEAKRLRNELHVWLLEAGINGSTGYDIAAAATEAFINAIEHPAQRRTSR